MPSSHLRLRSLAGRPRPARVAASVVLTVGLLGSAATAAQAAEPAPSAPVQPAPVGGEPSAAPTAEHPGLRVTVTGDVVLKPGERIGVGTPVRVSLHLENTGDVPVAPADLDLLGLLVPVGESIDVRDYTRTVTAEEIAAGVVDISGPVTGRTPTGTVFTAPGYHYRLALPCPRARRAPAGEHPGLAVTTSGEFLVEPGEAVQVGTRVRAVSRVTNTGDVDLALSAGALVADSLPVGVSTEIPADTRVVTAEDLARGYLTYRTRTYGTTPSGYRYASPDVEDRLPLFIEDSNQFD
ncbi:hypothetical protein [Rathayibacter sp. VKM Ac-2760]|uniref:hypothetical protein n=1 Tax=Rathayibacter sp. VKM Ac-2760 TaxID=2609253 RepID=UPI0013185233|nr:hypothetical protein [Rathayibacter sp. VKM Ac-2760]QHC60184.1 hypothetical protein GSU72_17730 [Rathayibacter sp. VKM Ac-2760]